MIRTIAVIAATAVLVGCATTTQTYEFDKTAHYPYSGDSVWPAIIEVFAENNLDIRTLERASGLVAGEYRGAPAENPSEYACPGGMFLSPLRDTLSYNVFMREAPGGGSNVTVNVNVERLYRSSWDGSQTIRDCQSTGAIESTMHDSISSRL